MAFGPFATAEGRAYIDSGRGAFSEKQTETIKSGFAKGIPPQITADFMRWHALVTTDKNNLGVPIPGSKREKALKYIEKLPLTPAEEIPA